MTREKRESGKVNLLDNDVFFEMFKSELIHYDRLTFFLTKAAASSTETAQLIDLIKSISQLKEISSLFIENGKKSIQLSVENNKTDESESKKNDDLRLERRDLLSRFFKEYKEYIPLYNNYIIDCYENPQNYLELDGLLKDFNGLQSMLILPIQRGPRYLMLIEALIGNNSHLSDAASEELGKLKTYILTLLKDINESVAPLSAPTPAPVSAAESPVDEAPKPLRHKFGNLPAFIRNKKTTLSSFKPAKDAGSYFSVEEEVKEFTMVSVVLNSMFSPKKEPLYSESELINEMRDFDAIPYDEGAEPLVLG